MVNREHDEYVYILTEGSYSDRMIVGVYSTIEMAEQAQLLLDEDEVSDIQRCKFDYLPQVPEDLTAWYVYIQDERLKTSYPISPVKYKVPHERFTSNKGSLIGIIYCWARDEEHANKIALDKYYQYKTQLYEEES